MSQKALRHQHGREPQEFDVLKDNKDGTVDLSRNGELVIGSCIVSEDGKPGTCTLVKAAKAPKAPKGGKQPTDEEKALALENARAALKMAEEAFAKEPTNTDLGKRVDELRAAVEELES